MKLLSIQCAGKEVRDQCSTDGVSFELHSGVTSNVNDLNVL